MKQNLTKQQSRTSPNTNMKTQIELNPGVALRRRVSARTAVALLALATAIIPVLAADPSGSPAAAKLTTEIRPFHINVPEAELTELRRRINATKWPERETVADASQGVQLATMQKL